ncbi:MAG: hypothetical protein IPM42_06460 [Saprospiraceae bacterium]|nr:hypothetical protein [Saprospiraceae bacterium]
MISQGCDLSLDTIFQPLGVTPTELATNSSFGKQLSLRDDIFVTNNSLLKKMQLFRINNLGLATFIKNIDFAEDIIPTGSYFSGDSLISYFNTNKIYIHKLERSENSVDLVYQNSFTIGVNGVKYLSGNNLFIPISNSSFKNNNGAILHYKINGNNVVFMDTIFAKIPKENGHLGCCNQIQLENDRLYTLESFPRTFHIFEFNGNEWIDKEFKFNNSLISNFVAIRDTVYLSLSSYFGINKSNIAKLVYQNGEWEIELLSNSSINDLGIIIPTTDEFVSHSNLYTKLSSVKKNTGNTWTINPIPTQLITPSSTYNTWAQTVVANDSFLLSSDATYGELGSNSGVIVIYKRDDNGNWKEKSALYPEKQLIYPNYLMGTNTKLFKSNILATAYSHNDSGIQTNAVYLFEKINGTYKQTIFKPTLPNINVQFGNSIDMSEGRIVIGCPGCPNGGEVYLYDKNNQGNWVETKLKEPSGVNNAAFGNQVKLLNDELLISSGSVNGTLIGDGVINGYVGRLYQFKKVNANWSASTYLLPSHTNGETYAHKIAVSDNLIGVVNTLNVSIGRILFYKLLNNSLVLLHDSIIQDPFAHYWGRDFDFKDSMAVVSAVLANNTQSLGKGKLFIFNVTETSLSYETYVPDNIPDNTLGNFGINVAIYNDKILAKNHFLSQVELLTKQNGAWMHNSVMSIQQNNASPMSVYGDTLIIGNNSFNAGSVERYTKTNILKAVCKDTTLVLYYSMPLNINPEWINDGSQGCGALQFTVNPSQITTNNLGNNTITFTIQNEESSSSCNATIRVYSDLDKDGFFNNTDCDDTNAEINPNTIWIADADGDGFAVSTETKTQCEKPSGYILPNTSMGEDCDDTNAEINPNTIWIADADGDGFAVSTETKTQCEKPSGYILPNTSMGEDCDDTNAEINPNTIWIADADGDGFAVSTETKTQCEKPSGYILPNTSMGEDCDDTNAEINANTIWIADADGDGFAVSAETKTQCEKPSGYILPSTSMGEDCDDTSAEINPNTIWIADADGDGFAVSAETKTQCEKPSGYILPNTSMGEDCDDTSAEINPNTIWIADADGDGFAVSTERKTQCEKPSGYILPNTSMGEDCDDTNAEINPNAIEIPNNDIDENCDGEILTNNRDIYLKKFTIFPNPGVDKLFVNNSTGQIAFLDSYGNIIKSFFPSNEVIIEIHDLAPGLYIIKDESGQFKRFIKI